MTSRNRRDFLRLSAATLGAAATSGFWPALIDKALAIQPNNPTGTPSLADIEHVIVFMQENRSFDHYLGMLPGLRGFGDPRPAPIPSGNYVWYQPEGTDPGSRSFTAHIGASDWTNTAAWYQTDRATQSSEYVLPYAFNQPGNVAFQFLGSLDHSWKQSQDVWANWDGWAPLKSRQSMGFLQPSDLPFYYQLANAFTVCDDYRCAVFAATDPNRFYLWSGTCPPPMNFPDNYTTGGYVSDITHDNNSKITPAMYGQSDGARAAAVAAGVADWQTYAETLASNKVTWKIYQEDDNYGDNYLQYFKNFRVDNTGQPISQSSDPYFQTLYQRGRAFAPAASNVGDAVIERFANDIAAGMEPDGPELGTVRPGLPRVSWIVAPFKYCEHPSASPGDGESFTARLLDVLVNQHPEVFQKTVFLLMYDENDGYFDHAPAPVPPISAHYGQMTLADAGAAENMSSVPVGVGPRVPMMVISPWSTGGKVSSQLSDHTSVLRFLEQWLTAKSLGADPSANRCTLLSDWRRAVCGDLTETLDFSQPGSAQPINTVTDFTNGSVTAAVPSPQSFPMPATPLTRTACALGYEFFVHGRLKGGQYALQLDNTGSVGVALIGYWQPMSNGQSALHYTVEAGKSLAPTPVATGADGLYDWSVHGPNGFLREFRGNANNLQQLGQAPEVQSCYDVAGGNLQLTLDNSASTSATTFVVSDNAYYQNKAAQITVAAGAQQTLDWVGSPDTVDGAPFCSGWYDLSVRIAGDPAWLRRLAGCVQQQGGVARTDPAIGNPQMFAPSFTLQSMAGNLLRIDHATPPWHHRPLNWIGVFPAGTAPASGKELLRVTAPRGVGSVTTSLATLGAGQYDVWYLFDNGYATLAGPQALKV